MNTNTEVSGDESASAEENALLVMYKVITRESAAAAALKYKTRTEFSKGSNKEYMFCLKHKLMDEVCKHMGPPKKRGRQKDTFDDFHDNRPSRKKRTYSDDGGEDDFDEDEDDTNIPKGLKKKPKTEYSFESTDPLTGKKVWDDTQKVEVAEYLKSTRYPNGSRRVPSDAVVAKFLAVVCLRHKKECSEPLRISKMYIRTLMVRDDDPVHRLYVDMSNIADHLSMYGIGLIPVKYEIEKDGIKHTPELVSAIEFDLVVVDRKETFESKLTERESSITKHLAIRPMEKLLNSRLKELL